MTERYYLYDDGFKIVYYADELPEQWDTLIMLGVSDNPKPVMAAAAFLKNRQVISGFRVKPIEDWGT